MRPKIEINDLGNGKFCAQVRCNLCGETKEIVLTEDQFAGLQDWAFNGALIQDALPDLSADMREMFISGTCPECWDSMFGGDDDDEDYE